MNIGNARLYGLEEDLGLVGDQYQIAVSVLFVTYILSEVYSDMRTADTHTDRRSSHRILSSSGFDPRGGLHSLLFHGESWRL